MGPIAFALFGLVVGLIARLVVPTGRHYGCLGTIVLGMIGSVVGGTLGSLIAGDGFDMSRSGWIGSILGAVLLLVLVRWNDSGNRT